MIQGVTEATQSASFSEMSSCNCGSSVAVIILQDHEVESLLLSFIGIDGTNTTLNSGRVQINLKPLSARNDSASDIIRRLQQSLCERFRKPLRSTCSPCRIRPLTTA